MAELILLQVVIGAVFGIVGALLGLWLQRRFTWLLPPTRRPGYSPPPVQRLGNRPKPSQAPPARNPARG